MKHHWISYPIFDISEGAPESVDITLVGSPTSLPGGSGEPALVCMPSAVANAIFNATGTRVRRFPCTAERVKKALA